MPEEEILVLFHGVSTDEDMGPFIQITYTWLIKLQNSPENLSDNSTPLITERKINYFIIKSNCYALVQNL